MNVSVQDNRQTGPHLKLVHPQ